MRDERRPSHDPRKLIDHLQIALLAAQGIDQTTHNLRDESRVLVEAVKRAATATHAMRPEPPLLGCITYRDHGIEHEIGPESREVNGLSPTMHKRPSFEHERAVRP